MENGDNVFSFTYSAQEQEEIKQIRQKYADNENKLESLRRLDRSVTQKSTAVSLIVGIIGALLLGFGMSIIMTDIGSVFGSAAFAIGLIIGIIGVVIVSLAYPIYILITQKERNRIAPEIIRLSDELLN